MDIESLHRYLGELLAEGLDKRTPMVNLTDGWPMEIQSLALLSGPFDGSTPPRINDVLPKKGLALVLMAQGSDHSPLVGVTHHEYKLPAPKKSA